MAVVAVVARVLVLALVLEGAACFDLKQEGTSTDYYVDPVHGNDSNSGTDANHPFKTVTHARDVVSQQQQSLCSPNGVDENHLELPLTHTSPHLT